MLRGTCSLAEQQPISSSRYKAVRRHDARIKAFANMRQQLLSEMQVLVCAEVQRSIAQLAIVDGVHKDNEDIDSKIDAKLNTFTSIHVTKDLNAVSSSLSDMISTLSSETDTRFHHYDEILAAIRHDLATVSAIVQETISLGTKEKELQTERVDDSREDGEEKENKASVHALDTTNTADTSFITIGGYPICTPVAAQLMEFPLRDLKVGERFRQLIGQATPTPCLRYGRVIRQGYGRYADQYRVLFDGDPTDRWQDRETCWPDSG